MIHSVSCQLGAKTLTLETGKLARQADGAVLVSYGDTRILVTVCAAKTPKEGIDFFPLTVEFSEKFYAAGRIPGSFFRREGRPTTEATLSARMIDRPNRPLFPENFKCETQIVATVLSLDKEADIDSAAGIGASAALHISDIPFNGPTAAVRVGRADGDYIINPTWEMLNTGGSDLDVFIAGTEKAIMMVEGGANEVAEEEVLTAILRGHDEIKKVVGVIEQLRKKCGKPKREVAAVALSEDIVDGVAQAAKDGLMKALRTKEKQERYEMMGKVKEETLAKLIPENLKTDDPAFAKEKSREVTSAFEALKYDLMRKMILDEKKRIDARDLVTVRPIATEVGILPRTHGSSLFTRGETQVLATITLGTGEDEQIIDNLHENTMSQVLFHYNFPPFSVGEVGRLGGQSRREIGHGRLAERAVLPLIPKHDDFPYTIRIVCETLESNGSSSMGSVCSASMALMHAGVPIPKPIAGIAMGLIKEGSKVAILSDILGDEDHLGDMDFKVAGTKDGVTSIQMDIKIEGVDEGIMRTALAQAHEGRIHILKEMAKTIQQANTELSATAPRILSIMIPGDKIGEVIGPSGKNIKAIIADTGCKIDISDDGRVNIASSDGVAAQRAVDIIKSITTDPEVGKTYKGKVKKIVEFGAFVGITPTKDGLLHISEISYERVNEVTDVLKEGDEVEVKLIEIDRMGKMRLSRKALLPPPAGGIPPPRSGGRDGPPRGGGGGRPGGGNRPRSHQDRF